LLDGDIDPELADYLRVVGFDVQLAPRENPIIQDDVEVLRFARRRRRILVCHDSHSDTSTRLRLYPELYHRGGKILHIGGDSSQHLLVALGKVLVNYEHWSEWLQSNDGRVSVFATKWVPTSADEFMARHIRHVYRTSEDLPLPPRQTRQSRRRSPGIPSEQLPLG
jgi:hypothetical protein